MGRHVKETPHGSDVKTELVVTRVAINKKNKQVPLKETIRLVHRLIFEYGLQYRGRFVVAVLCMLLVAGSTAMIAWLTRSMVNSIFVDGNRNAVWGVGFAIMAAFTVKGVFGYFQTVLMGSIGLAITAKLQRAQFDKLLRMKISHYSGRNAGGVVAKVINSARAARSIIISVTTSLIRDAFTLVALTGVMIYQDPFMSMFALLAAPVIIVALYLLVRAIKRVALAEADLIAGVNVVGVESLQGLKVVKSFNLEGEMGERIGRAIDKMEDRQNSINRISAVASPLFDVLGGLIIGSFVFYAGWQTLANDKTPGEFMAFITAFLLAFEPARRLGAMNVEIQRQIVAVKGLFDLLENEQDMEADTKEARALDFHASSGHVKFDSVSFRYGQRATPTLADVSFEANPGEIVAIVGRSGAGKSTIVNLILGLYRPEAGNILLDGRQISDLSLDQLRRNVSYVAQDTFLFSGSIRDNVLFGKPDASDQQVVEALRSAGAMDFVAELPEGLDSEVGDNGGSLSGGQRQRIAIARALLKDAPILILDEATSALDGETERNVRSALGKLPQGRTAIIIAHRLTTIQEADKVIVLDKGQIVGEGTHQQLEETNETYRSLFVGGEVIAG